MKTFQLLVGLLMALSSVAQQTISGIIAEKTSQGELPLPGVIIRWVNNPQNPVLTDQNGEFKTVRSAGQHQLIISSVGYRNDTVMAHGEGPFFFYLQAENKELGEVVVKSTSTAIDRISPQQTQIITTKELAKAACCNLSESFETNASVNVSYSDAVTGSRQIQMLGLSGKYVQTNLENMPGVRGLAVPFGLNYVPGTWVQSIDVAKGVSSVINGYESMTGALNVELQKPDLAEPLYVNAYVNELGRAELNLNLAKKFNEKWSSGLFSHGSLLKNSIDRNGDSFMDLPEYDQINLLNRWKYSGDRLMAQFGAQYTRENREGGEIQNPLLSRLTYRFTNESEKLTLFSKTALLFPETPYRGLGLILNGSFHTSDSKFGVNPYLAKENLLYANLIYQDIFGNTQHTYKTGLSFLLDQFDEQFANFDKPVSLQRNERVPGVFFEYTFNKLDRSILVAGVRADYHNLFGFQVTPRLHFKQDIGSGITLRFSVGRGMRVPNPLTEFYGQLVSSRAVQLLPGNGGVIQPEVSWNTGLSLTSSFGKNSLILEAYHTRFQSQVIMDMETPGSLLFYHSREKSYANSAQAELILVPSERWEMKLAYRLLDVKQTMIREGAGSQLIEQAFVPKSFALLNASYALPYNKWKADATVQYRGKQRLPGAVPSFAPGFFTVNGQISRAFVRWEYYLGIENALNFRQANPIINAQNPFSEGFDAGMVWGPVLGRVSYLGMRYRLK